MHRISEQAFKNAIADVLFASGYHCHFSQDFDRENAIFLDVALKFIQTAQAKA